MLRSLKPLFIINTTLVSTVVMDATVVAITLKIGCTDLSGSRVFSNLLHCSHPAVTQRRTGGREHMAMTGRQHKKDSQSECSYPLKSEAATRH